jgi:sugar lactone lactonase YvrE
MLCVRRFRRDCRVLAVVFALCVVCGEAASQTSVELFVSSRNSNSVKRFDGMTGAYLGDFVATGSGGLSMTQEVRFGPDGSLYVSGRGDTSLLRYDGVTGEFLGNATKGYKLDNPTKMTFGPDGNVYVSQWGAQRNKVARFNAASGAFIDECTSTGLNEGSGHAWDADGNLYVACYGTHDVRKFDSTGAFLGVFTASGHLSGPVNLWFGHGGDLFVLDWALGSVLRFDGTTGAFQSVFLIGLQNAEGFAFGPDGLLYICDWTANNVKRFDSTGSYLGVFTIGGNLLAPNSLVFRSHSSSGVAPGNAPFHLGLNQNYPNPFNPATTISYSLAHSSKVVLTIYDIIGREVSTVVNDVQASGEHIVTFHAGSRLGAGVYIYSLRTGDAALARKMSLLK